MLVKGKELEIETEKTVDMISRGGGQQGSVRSLEYELLF